MPSEQVVQCTFKVRVKQSILMGENVMIFLELKAIEFRRIAYSSH
jgi:hypothetical protein